MIFVSHEGLFIHLDLGCSSSFHNVWASIIMISVDVGMHTSLMVTNTLSTCLEILVTLTKIYVHKADIWQRTEAFGYGRGCIDGV